LISRIQETGDRRQNKNILACVEGEEAKVRRILPEAGLLALEIYKGVITDM